MRIDSCLQPAGLIAAAQMFTLVLKEDQVYLLHTGKGPAFQRDYSRALQGMQLRRGQLENMAVNALLQKYVTQITGKEKLIDALNPHLYIEKKNITFSVQDISDFEIRERTSEIRMSFRISGKKVKFDCPITAKAKILELQKDIKRMS